MPPETTVKAYPLLRAQWLLSPQEVARPRQDHVWLAASAFAFSGLTLGFIMLLGVGYEPKNQPPEGPSSMAEAESGRISQIEGAAVVDAVPLRDEDGLPLQRP